jgi:hypothetical protein
MLGSFLIIFLSLISLTELISSKACWTKSYLREGSSPSCTDEDTLSNGKCKKACKPGYNEFLDSCWQTCPNGFTNHGAFCFKPQPKGRTGYFSEGTCNGEHAQGCENYWGLYYPRCEAGFSPVGCCICSPICDGMVDIGISCAKDFYLSIKEEASCGFFLELVNGSCLPACKSGYTSFGAFCVRGCPSGYTSYGVLCSEKNDSFGRKIEKEFNNSINQIMNIIGSDREDFNFSSYFDDFNIPICDYGFWDGIFE